MTGITLIAVLVHPVKVSLVALLDYYKAGLHWLIRRDRVVKKNMLLHFVKRGFADQKLGWGVLALIWSSCLKTKILFGWSSQICYGPEVFGQLPDALHDPALLHQGTP